MHTLPPFPRAALCIMLAVGFSACSSDEVTGTDGDDDFVGVVERRPEGTAGTWQIGGRSFEANTATRLVTDDGPIIVGACVSVDFEGTRAVEIESEPASACRRG